VLVASAAGRVLVKDIEASFTRLVVEFVDRPLS
jgi:hypothetical protein